jgi:(p)ppGpp synthase/HD superfamily hydrolase
MNKVLYIEHELVDRAKRYAIACHSETNHKYDGQPYEIHLSMCFDYALKYINLIDRNYAESALAAAWTHDLIEDCRQTYNDVKQNTNWVVADITYALTNEKGKTRKERANDKYYKEISENRLALYVKLCDRLANVSYSVQKGSRMADLYLKENGQFKNCLFDPEFKIMFDEIDYLLGSKPTQEPESY